MIMHEQGKPKRAANLEKKVGAYNQKVRRLQAEKKKYLLKLRIGSKNANELQSKAMAHIEHMNVSQVKQETVKEAKLGQENNSEDEEVNGRAKKVDMEDFDRALVGTEFVNSDDDDGFSRGSAGNDDY